MKLLPDFQIDRTSLANGALNCSGASQLHEAEVKGSKLARMCIPHNVHLPVRLSV